MTDKEPTDLRAAWHAAVAKANEEIDRLERAKTAPLPDERYVRKCEEMLARAQGEVDEAYKAYVMDNQNWVSESPGRFDVVVVPSFIDTPDGVFGSVTFSFSAGTELEPVTVTLVNSEFEMRRFQRNISRAFDVAIKRARQRNKIDPVVRLAEVNGDQP